MTSQVGFGEARNLRRRDVNRFASAVSHSHTINVCQPSRFSAAKCSASRSTLRSSFGSQYDVFECGFRASLHFRSGCWCQKHPCTKITFRRRTKTKSGFPGRFFRCSRNLYPSACADFRTMISGLVFFDLISAMRMLRSDGERLSVMLHQDRGLPPIEILTQYIVHQVRLQNTIRISGALNKFLVIVSNNELLVILRECPGTHMAVQVTSSASVAFYVIALLAERLPVAQIVRAVPRTGNFMIWAKLDGGLLLATVSAPETELFFDFLPLSAREFCSRLALLTNLKALQLISGAFLYYRGESLLALQFAHTAKNVHVWFFVMFSAVIIYGGANIGFRQNRAWNAMPFRPECAQNDRIVLLVCFTGRDKGRFSVGEPSGPAVPGFRWVCPWGQKKPLTCSRLGHHVGSL